MRTPDNRRSRGRPTHPDVLTPAEWRVLDELREGRTNAEIAARLGISVNTVRSHVSTMLAKLDLAHRHELATWDGRPAEVPRRTTGRAIALPLLWARHALASPAAGKSALVLGAAGLSVAAMVALASFNGGEGSAPPPLEPPAASTEEPTTTATPPEAPPHPDMPRTTVSPGYDPRRFADLIAVLTSRQEPTIDAWYGSVEGIALLDPNNGEIVARVDAGFGNVTARRRHSAGELLLTGSHPDSGPYPEESMARLFVLDADSRFETKRVVDLPNALSSRGRTFSHQPGHYVLSNDERYLYYVRYERRDGTTDIISIGILDLDADEHSITVVPLPRNCGGSVAIVSAGDSDATVTCRQIHRVLLIDPAGDVLREEDFGDVAGAPGGTPFGFLAPSGELGLITAAGSVHLRDDDGEERDANLLGGEHRAYWWTDLMLTDEGALVIGAYVWEAGAGHRNLEHIVEFDLESLSVLRELPVDASTSLIVPRGRSDDMAVLTAEGDVVFPVDGRRIETGWHSDPHGEASTSDPDDTDFSFGLVP